MLPISAAILDWMADGHQLTKEVPGFHGPIGDILKADNSDAWAAFDANTRANLDIDAANSLIASTLFQMEE
ncbi:hypothetical protein GX50_01569 [[Emmonsia] crescens]|uniref:Uncharacterized protein n=1 Tax=[Emmonsia] crescens TaxID=73230 RepID=A0A2B7ZQX6_9EURO|nr:hypothetical protein GX50_01569 [Emmonsia crescens]